MTIHASLRGQESSNFVHLVKIAIISENLAIERTSKFAILAVTVILIMSSLDIQGHMTLNVT